jgi:hypothetical protein
LLLYLLLSLGCIPPSWHQKNLDPDGDGAGPPDDCSPMDSHVHPGADDLSVDQIDQNCDGVDGPPVRSLASADVRFEEETEGDQLGYSLTGGCDINDDGLADLVIGARRHNHADSTTGPGAVYLIPGADTWADGLASAARLDGAAPDDEAGTAVACHGEGDASVLAIGAPGAGEENEGAVYVLTSPTFVSSSLSVAPTSWVGEERYDGVGEVVALGHMDEDEDVDLLIGAPLCDTDSGDNSGAVYLIFGPVSPGQTALSEADIVFTGAEGSDRAGSALATLDVNGRRTLVVGAEYADDKGAVYLVDELDEARQSLSGARFKLTGEHGLDRAGAAVAAGHDVDGDGDEDLLVGAVFYSEGLTNRGAVYVVADIDELLNSGEDELQLGLTGATLLGVVEGGQAGTSLSLTQSVDGDDQADMLIGAFARSRVHLVLGESSMADVQTIEIGDSRVFAGEQDDNGAGESVSFVGDFNGDELEDLLIGGGGLAYLILGPLP